MGTKTKKPPAPLAERIAAEIRKAMNDEEAAMTFGGQGLSSVREVMPTGIEVLDQHVLGIGGFPYGRIVEIFGPEDVGKSSLANQIMAAGQRDGATALLGEAERKVQPGWVDLFGVSRKDVVLQPADTIEQWCESVGVAVEKFGARHKLVAVLDSAAAPPPQKAFEEDLTDAEIPGAAGAAWSRCLRKLKYQISGKLVLIVLVNQLRSKIGVLFGPTEESPGGRAIKFHSSVRLIMGHGPHVKAGKATTGRWVSVRAVKNHLVSERRSARVLLDFQRGWDNDRSTLLFAKETGIVDKKCRSLREARIGLGWGGEDGGADVRVDDVGEKE